MTSANVSQGSSQGLPATMHMAQAAMDLPEVKEMLCKLSKYHLGIVMPHAHDAVTGEFQPLADNVMQVEAGLAVSFRPTAEIVNQPGRFLPVAWCWRGGAPTAVTACEMIWEEASGDPDHAVKHKM